VPAANVRISWQRNVLPKAREISESYAAPPTLRQLFYRLVAAQLIPNTDQAYRGLSRTTAEARRAGEFPSSPTAPE
jgi:hypothetical protein